MINIQKAYLLVTPIVMDQSSWIKVSYMWHMQFFSSFCGISVDNKSLKNSFKWDLFWVHQWLWSLHLTGSGLHDLRWLPTLFLLHFILPFLCNNIKLPCCWKSPCLGSFQLIVSAVIWTIFYVFRYLDREARKTQK